MGERDVENAMPWDKIDAADYTVWDKTANFNKAIINSKNRIQNNAQFRLIERTQNGLIIVVRNNYSLNIDKFKVEQNAIEEAAKNISQSCSIKFITIYFSSL
jgi:carboxyl-terminal processing protease